MSGSVTSATNSLFLQRPPAETRVVVAMSGGVDSSLVAALLKREGYDVVGVTLQLYDDGALRGRKGACCAGQDIHDARRVATQLSIPHYVLDYEKRFAEAVIAPFADSYIAGETPIPCVACNQQVKFADLLGTARELQADVMATGHYVELRPQGDGFALHRAQDRDRDQSYFLFATTPEQLGFLRFPLGNMKKAEVRALARDLDLPVAEKADSQDICFVPDGRYARVIERLKPGAGEPGDIVHVDGRVLGQHGGIIHYTIGQRRGLGVAHAEPLYVVRLDAKRRRVVVGPRACLRTERILLKNVNWIGDQPVGAVAAHGLGIFVKVRSAQEPQPASLFCSDEGVEVRLHNSEYGVSPGQACVFYADGDDGSRVLGGGWIARQISIADAELENLALAGNAS
jgi:tRNA-specific 2-thiouridylase